MDQEKRNKRNAQYKQNLQKRYELTKSSDYKTMCSKGIPLSKNIKPLTHEFILTRKHGRIVSREVYKYKWTPEANAIRKEYHATKNGIPNIPTKPIKSTEKKSKEDSLKERSYSDYHNKLIQNLYSSNKAERIANQQAYKAAHETKIKKLIDKLAEYKMSKKLRYMQQRPYKVVISTKDNEEFQVTYSNLSIKQLTDTITKLNQKLSEKYENHKSITIINRLTSEKKCFARTLPEIKQAA